jgi:hypothetical protein
MSCEPNQYVVTLASNGDLASLRYRRTSTGESDTSASSPSAGKNFLQILVPQTKQNGSANPAAGTVVLLWKYQEANIANVEVETSVKLVEIGCGGYFSLPLADFKDGWFYAYAVGGSAIEIHCTEVSQ